jgi:phosphatidylethanolamine/phosphatidyl-N-methylethanolamine N-methyltransferase
MQNWSLLIKELLHNPAHIGAIAPSSKSLSNALAKHIPQEKPGKIVELGAGTGVITEAMLEHGIPAEDIIIVERSASMVHLLREKFPQITIIHGDAIHLDQYVAQESVKAIISSLPLRSLTQDIVQTISAHLDNLLTPGSYYIHYTYSLFNGSGHTAQNLQKIHTQRIWRNLPPARVEVYVRQ